MLKKLLFLTIIPFLFCSCTNNNVENITFSSWGSVTETKILKQQISNFELENPNIKINFIHAPQNYFQKLHLLFASNQAPDILFINNLYLPIYSTKLEDLSELINKKEFYPQSIQAMSIDNKLLAIPRDVSTLVFYRNKDLIQKKPKNLEELKDTISINKNYGISYERDMYYLFPYTLTMGEEIFSPQKSLEYYKGLEGKYAPTPAEVGSSTLAQMFLAGKIGLYLSGRWMYPKIKQDANFNWDIIVFPGIVPLDSSGWAISKESKHKDSAKKFVEYLASEKSSEYFLSTGLIVPARINVAKKIDEKVFLDSISNSQVLKIDKNYRKKIDKMDKELFN